MAQSGASFVGGETLTLSAVTLELQNTSATTGSNNLNDLINLNSGALLQLDAGATFNDATTTGGANALLIQSTSGTAGSVSNLGTWEKTGNSSGNDKIVVAFSSTGTDAGHLATVNVAAGTLNLAGNGADTFTSYTGAGTIQFSGTTRTIDVNSSITANAMFSAGTTTVNGTYNAASTTVNGGTANLDGTITGLGAASISSGTLNINGATTTATGLSESGGTLSGLGALTVTGTTSFSGSSSDTGSSPTTSKIVAQSGASFAGGETLTLSAVTLELQNTQCDDWVQ